jgi:hypothetical protein
VRQILEVSVVTAAIAMASPACAQSFNPAGWMPYGYAPGHAVHHGGLQAYGMVPQVPFNANNPALTGGGSSGYNPNLPQHLTQTTAALSATSAHISCGKNYAGEQRNDAHLMGRQRKLWISRHSHHVEMNRAR